MTKGPQRLNDGIPLGSGLLGLAGLLLIAIMSLRAVEQKKQKVRTRTFHQEQIEQTQSLLEQYGWTRHFDENGREYWTSPARSQSLEEHETRT